ncbi:unnamed protein product [Cuscuta europaea]|uniref:RRM domain-containing protein n=1 Tax=Cuscuta europaea TaxID=41803 RepID=A0A9P0YFL4_CUSEU|nr:unnamed protein product [Cuscuta europaea]
MAMSPNLYVGNLHPDTTEDDLRDAFSSVGPLDSVLILPLTHKSLCYAFVSFFDLSQALMAVTHLNHKHVRGKPMRIMWWQRYPNMISKSGIGNVFVKNLPPSVTSDQLERKFSGFGTILSCKVAEDENGMSKCFGFVQFDSQLSATSAITHLHGTVFKGKTLYVSTFKKKELRASNLYVGNLSESISETKLEEIFGIHGEVVSVKIIRRGGIKVFGFVKFSRAENAKAAMDSLHGTAVDGKPMHVALACSRKPNRPHQIFTSPCNNSLYDIPTYSMPVPIEYFNHYQPSVCQLCATQLSTYEWQLPMRSPPGIALPPPEASLGLGILT